MVDNQDIGIGGLHKGEDRKNVPKMDNTGNNVKKKCGRKNNRTTNNRNRSKKINDGYPYILRQWKILDMKKQKINKV